MMYSVIYSFDCYANVSVKRFKPPHVRKWEMTECHTAEAQDVYGKRGKHRKYCAILDQKEFDEFVDHCGLYCEHVHTMGSLGAPGYGAGVAPAVSFTSDDQEAYQNAYVTPSGSAAEIVAWLRYHGRDVPPILLDDPNQTYLVDGVPEDEGGLVWKAIEQLMWDLYEHGVPV